MAIKLYSTIIAATLLCTSHPATADANIKQLQRKLIEFGYDAVVADGIWGKNTETALSAFLASNGLIFDGVIDANEFALLGIPPQKPQVLDATITFTKVCHPLGLLSLKK